MKTKLLLWALAMAVSTGAFADRPEFPLGLEKRKAPELRAKRADQQPLKGRFYTWNKSVPDWEQLYEQEFTYNIDGALVSTIGTDPVTKENVTKTERVIDSKGVETGVINYTWDGSAWQITNGNRRVNTYNSKGLLEQSVPENYHVPSSSWLQYYRYSYTYDQDDNLVTELTEEYNGSQWDNFYKTTSTYQGGNLISELSQMWDGTQWGNNNLNTYTYTGNEISEMVTQFWESGQWENFKRFTNMSWNLPAGEPSAYIVQDWDDTQWENTTKYEAVYDSLGGYVALHQNWDGASWEDQFRQAVSYDAMGNMTLNKMELYNVMGSEWEVDYWQEIEYTYDGNNITVKVTKSWDSVNEELVNAVKEEFFDFSTVTSLAAAHHPVDKIVVYPNPVSDVLNVTVNANEIGSLSLTDLTGRQVIEQAVVTDGQMRLDVSGLECGVYLLQLRGSNAQEVRRIVKQ